MDRIRGYQASMDVCNAARSSNWPFVPDGRPLLLPLVRSEPVAGSGPDASIWGEASAPAYRATRHTAPRTQAFGEARRDPNPSVVLTREAKRGPS